MLLFPGVEETVAPIIEGEIELQGRTYPILKAQPLPHTFRWDDKYKKAESRLFCLNDVGHGACLFLTIMLSTNFPLCSYRCRLGQEL